MNERPVFKGYKNQTLRSRTVQLIAKITAWIAGLERDVTPTMLRNSFAIHHLQAGTEPEILQVLMGLESEQSMHKYIFETDRERTIIMSPMYWV